MATAPVITVLLWPFPLARAALAPIVQIVSILVLWQLIQVGYYAVCAGFWRKTAGMHLLGGYGIRGLPCQTGVVLWCGAYLRACSPLVAWWSSHGLQPGRMQRNGSRVSRS